MQGCLAFGYFLIDRQQQRIPQGAQAREARLVPAPKSFQVFPIGEFHLLLGDARQVVRDAEEKDVDLHSGSKALCRDNQQLE